MKQSNRLFLALCLVMGTAAAVEPADPARLDAVSERGKAVMPFALARTTHVFAKTDDGGRQQVVVKDSADAEQIRLIREHLSQLADAFSRGDFSGPASIHGDAMPGLSALRAAPPGAVEYHYSELPDGGQIDYVSKDSGLTDAIHRYFDAQLSDHARHAVPGTAHHGAAGHP